jgi:hypothetical protein
MLKYFGFFKPKYLKKYNIIMLTRGISNYTGYNRDLYKSKREHKNIN